MKPRYTVTVTDHKTGEQMDFEMSNVKYKMFTEPNHETGDPMARLTVYGSSLLVDYKEENGTDLGHPCAHDWINCKGLSEGFEICGNCGSKK